MKRILALLLAALLLACAGCQPRSADKAASGDDDATAQQYAPRQEQSSQETTNRPPDIEVDGVQPSEVPGTKPETDEPPASDDSEQSVDKPPTLGEEEASGNDISLPPFLEEPTETEDIYPKMCTYELRARVGKDMPEYRFVATGVMTDPEDWYYGYVLGIDIYDETGSLILFESFSEAAGGGITGYAVYNEMMDTMGLHVVDVNFDGRKDVILLNTFAGAHGNSWYDCWLWDDSSASFVKSASFAEICNPAIDSAAKCIYSAGGGGASYWGASIYRYIGGEFVVTNRFETYGDGLVETALIDGKMETVRDVPFDWEDETGEAEWNYYTDSELWQMDHPRWYMMGGHIADQWLG